MPPAIVMGPGIGAQREFGYPPVAEQFAGAGYAVLLFDYRGFGASDSQAGVIDPQQQRADYVAAVRYLSQIEEVGDSIVLWGWSLAGGHALSIAAERDDIDAVVAFSPVTDGRGLVRDRSVIGQIRAVLSGVRDALGGRVNRGHEIPVVGDKSSAVVPDPEAKRGYLDLIPRDAAWQNAVAARSLLKLANYQPVDQIETLQTPVFLAGGRNDRQVAVETLDTVVDTLRDPTYLKTGADHFSMLEDDLDVPMGSALAFLAETLR